MTELQAKIVFIARRCKAAGKTMTHAELATALGYDVTARPAFADYARTWARWAEVSCIHEKRSEDREAVRTAFTEA